MQMKQCPNGHFFDQSKTDACPYCTSESANVNAMRPILSEEAPAHPGPEDRTLPLIQRGPAEAGRTMAVIKKEIGVDPVVGWLVCTDGPDKGRDYRIHSDNNYIGRSDKMDISVRGDETISRENHAIITFDTRGTVYYFSPGDGRSIVRVNGNAVFSAIEISAGDKIEIGMTTFLFVPLCGEAFTWAQ